MSPPLAPPVRVLVVAPSPIVRAGLESLLAADPGMLVIASTAPGARVADIVGRDHPDVILIDRDPASRRGGLRIPGDASEPDAPPVVLLVDLDDDADGASGIEALRGGASAVLSRGASASAIVSAVRAAAAGLVVVERDTIGGLLVALPAPTGASGQEPADEGSSPLTPRELEVLAMLAEGLGNKRIAARLAISEHTVKFHLASVYAKLRVSTRTEAVTAGVRRGLVML